MGIRSFLLSLAFVSLFALGASAEKAWQTSDNHLKFKAPDAFAKVQKLQKHSALELFDKAQNVEIVVSKILQSEVDLAKYLKIFPEMIASQGGKVLEVSSTKAGKDPAALFILTGLVPDQLETIYVYAKPPRGSYSFVVNYPAKLRGPVLSLTKQMLTTVQRS